MQYFSTSMKTPIHCISVGQFISNEAWRHAKRTIDSYEMIIGVGDILYIEVAGIQYEVKPGDILLIPPETIYLGYLDCSPGVSFYWFHFYCQNKVNIRNKQNMDQLVNEIKIK